MKLSTRLALFATVFAIVLTFFAVPGSLSIIVLAWAAKFIFGSLIDEKA